jgi:hypothetical protein
LAAAYSHGAGRIRLSDTTVDHGDTRLREPDTTGRRCRRPMEQELEG